MSFETVIHLIQSASVLVVAALLLALLGSRLDRRPLTRRLVIGLIFGIAGFLSMAGPLEILPGILLDARSVVIALSAGFGGIVGVTVTAAIVIAVRLWIDSGALPGVVGIVVTALGGALYWYFTARHRPLKFQDLVALGLVATLLPLPTLLLLPKETALLLVKDALPFTLPINFAATILMGLLVLGDRQRRWALSSMKDAVERLQGVTDNAPGMFFQQKISPDGKPTLLFVSKGVERLLGVSPEDFVNGSIDPMSRVPDAYKEEVTAKLRQAAVNSTAWDLETPYYMSNGSEIWLRGQAQPRQDDNGQTLWEGFLIDITAQKQAEQMKNEFISTVSHELRTPLTSIRGSLGLITGGAAGELPPKAKTLLQIAQANSERLVRLINDILDMERIESGRMPFHIQAYGLRHLIDQAVEANSGYFNEHSIGWTIKDNAPGAEVLVDSDRFHQVMNNLLSNAIKFSPAGGDVSISLDSRPKSIRVSVSDRGPGIPEAFRTRIFGKFEQADSSDTKQKGGTGLGLSISKAIAERLGGALSFESQAGQGTTFYVDVPIAEQIELQAPLVTEGWDRVLVVEDDHDVARLIKILLQDEGIDCDIAHGVASAKRLIRENNYKAITLDIRLAGESGIEVFRDLRANKATEHLPVVVISAIVDEARAAINGSALGVVDWIQKPVDPERFALAIRKACQTSAGKPRILHIEDDLSVREVIAAAIGDDVSIDGVTTSAEALERLAGNNYSTVILDLSLPDGSGADLLPFIPTGTAVIIFSAMDISEALKQQVTAALTKTRTTEIDVAKVIRDVMAKSVASRTPEKT
ncbi:ATP-binding protein [Phyllobacterium bourgognense]|uniref:histidine kinase n=1 Tax=Phyllobacterium bourgognense TaxID=314236 RepID=A0A368YMS6_9HYPH|nr:ATP-binding protein [Phyllobacterium bourgognense]RCW81530.1 PAS domain S-box-containing protein [Phyllobacterium bourgognense]